MKKQNSLLIETEVCHGGYHVYNPEFRIMTIPKIERIIDPAKNWIPYGYNTFTFHRKTATVSIRKV